MLSPMRLEDFHLRDLVIRSKEPGPEDASEMETVIEVRHARHKSRPRFILDAVLGFRFEAHSSSPYAEIRVAFQGIFEFPADMPDDIIRRFYPVVAMANLLGMVRGSLVQTTGVFKGGAFHLPLLNLNQIKLMDAATEQLLFPSETVIELKAPATKRKSKNPNKKSSVSNKE